MDEQPGPSERDVNESTGTPPEGGRRGGVDIRGGEVRAGRDVIGGDVNVAGDSISGQTVTVQRGFSASDVQRIALAVGGLVFLTAACFFIFGAISAAALVGVVNRPLLGGSSPQDAASMQNKIAQIQALQPGEQFRVRFTEDEVSSYFRFVLGPQLGVSDGRARFMAEPGQIAVSGNLDSAGGRPFLGQLQLTTDRTPFKVEGAWLKVLGTPEGSAFGWVPVTPLAQGFADQLNGRVFGRVQFTQLAQTGGGSAAPPEVGNNLVLTGVVR